MAGADSIHTEFEAAGLAVRRARRQRADERGAFDQFCMRVEGLPTGGDQPDMAPDANCAIACRHEMETTGPGAVREAYEATVMAVPHYWEVYDDPFSEHVATELGHDVTTDLRRAGTLTPTLKQRVVDAAAAAHHRRVDAIRTLDAERSALDGARQAIVDILDGLSGAESTDDFSDQRIEAIRDRCRTIARKRRTHLAEHDLVRETEPTWVSSADSAVQPRLSTLYADLSARDPVLAAVDQLRSVLPETGVDTDVVSEWIESNR
jgi:hypothetical protein